MQNQKVTASNSENSSTLYATYELIIAQNILNQLNIFLNTEELFDILKSKDSKYFTLLKVPMLSSFNGMILSQIDSYRLFCQKRLADYIIATSPTQEQQASPDFEDIIPDNIEKYKEDLVELQKTTKKIEQDYYNLIARTQSYLKKIVNAAIINSGNFSQEFSSENLEKIAKLYAEANQQSSEFMKLRETWEHITTQLCILLSEKTGYSIDLSEDITQRSELNFLKNLGIKT